ncbi:MAG: phosphotransferase family protein [Chloroflexi bacterium]|nr:phosphotransferase family protein [Chloroflexota bacterium]
MNEYTEKLPQPDLIDVRPDEGFDEARLADYLRGKLPGVDGGMTVRQFGGGKANLTYLLRFASGREYVLRRPPLGPIAPSSHDMGREYRVLSVLHRAYPFAPRSWLYCEDSAVIGAAFQVMTRCRGIVVRERLPKPFADDPTAGRKMSGALVDALAALHAVDYADLGLAQLGKPAGFIQRQVDGWQRRWRRARLQEDPQVERIYRWLQKRVPKNSANSLVHNDPKLDNTMFAADDPARVVAILDWDMCTLGDPLSDLGALLTYWTQPDDPPPVRAIAMMPTSSQDFLSRDELVQRYASASRLQIADIRFYHVLGIFRLLVILQQIYIRYLRGQTQDQRFASLGAAVAALTEWALDIAGG